MAATPVFGTHDLALIARIVERAATSGVGKDKYQIHMLYGIRDSGPTPTRRRRAHR